MRKLMIMAGILLLCFPVIVSAQGEGFIQKNDIGFSFFTYAPTEFDGDVDRVIGLNLVYHPLPFIAIEPGIFYYSETGDRKDNMTGQVDLTFEYDGLGYELGIFYYRNLSTNLYMYAGPRFQFVYYDSSQNYPGWNRFEYETSDRYIVLTLGFKYMFNDHFGVFGDLGYGFGTEEVDSKEWDNTGALVTNETTETDVGYILNGYIGITFYL